MDNFQKFVGRRLRRMTPTVGEHPDADVLTAFAEQLLEDRERRLLIDHLAFCADCREVIVLALPDPDRQWEIQSVPTLGRASTVRDAWLQWPSFRWVALAAATLVITTIGIQYGRQSLHHDAISTSAQTIAPAHAASTQESPLLPSGLMKAQSKPHSLAGQSPDIAAMVASAPTQQQPRRHFPLRHSPKPTTVDGDSLWVAMNHAPPTPGSDDNSEIVKAKAPVATSVESGPPISSPALPLQTSPSMMLRASPRWTVTAAGMLQRSFDGGNTWEMVEPRVFDGGVAAPTAAPTSGSAESSQNPNATFRAVSAVGSEVWAGGTAGMLYHTSDGGNHWAHVSPSDGEVVLSSDIATINFSDPQHGTISTLNAELWSTVDAGQTWKKQQ